ncbi:MAG TPA: MG2 domain-containing protein, partial [Acetobacteraceae bacterium]|nr:MG2 domain-containing protein [Acetobacteraceae bacterium]
MRSLPNGVFLCLLAVFLARAPVALAQTAPESGAQIQLFIGQTLPGLAADAARLRFDLTRRHTALSAAAPGERAAAEAELRKAEAAHDWNAARAAAERRIRLGNAGDPALWLSLAAAELKDPTGSAKTALQAAYIGFAERRNATDEPALTRQALLLMRQALGRLGDHLAEIRLLGEIVQAWPDDATAKAQLQRAVSRYGFAVRKIDTEPQSFPARACIAFTLPLPADEALHPGDYVSTEPAIAALAVSAEQGRLCLSGLPPGATTVVKLHPGLPGIAGTRLERMLTIRISLANRQPSLLADPTHFIIPASQPPAIGFASVNISKLKVKIARVAERSLRGFLSNHPLLNPGAYASGLNGENAPVVFTGSAGVPDFVRNRLMHTVLPLADVMQKPGLYAVSLAPGDGTPDEDGSLNLVQLVLRTNLAPTTWRGADGLTVQLRRFTDAGLVAGATVALIARDNAVLATADTGADGMAHFAAPLLAGPGGEAPAALHITGADGDFTLVNLDASPFDLTDRGVSGRPQPKPIDPYIWLDRGIYRPGETLHVGALLRSPDLKPLDVPLHLIVRRPGGQVFADQVVHWTADSSLVEPITLSPGAQAGSWTIALAMSDKDPALASRSFTVAAFVPARLAVDFAQHPPLAPGRIDHQPVTVRFLYGAPGANLTGTASVHITADATPFAAFKDYRFGLHDEITNAPLLQPTLPQTDAKGATSVPIDLTHLPDATHALKATVSVTINDPSGRAVTRSTTLPIVPKAALIGIKPDFTGGAVDQGAKPGFELAAVAPDGKPVAMQVDLSLVRQDYEWEVIWNASVARWHFSYIDRPVLTRTLTIEPGQPYHLELPALPYGRYRLRLVQHAGGLAASSAIFYSGWVTSDNPAVPARLTVARDKRIYAAGDTAHLHITAPFAGRATLVLANSKVISTRDFDLSKDGADLTVPVSADWGAGAYAVVHVYRPADGKTPPDRAVGLTWLGLTPGDRKLPVTIAAQKLYRPDRDVDFAVHTTPGA